MKFISTIVLFLFFSLNLSAQQQLAVFGAAKEENSNRPLRGASVSVLLQSDSSMLKSVLTDSAGRFNIEGLSSGRYILSITGVGYREYISFFNLSDASKEFGELFLLRDDKSLQSVTVLARRPAVVQRGDTTEYDAGRYKVNPDANAEDMMKKMPGITVDRSGAVTAQGEQVRNVTVDGRRYFGDDATAALRNLPAEIIDKIQVFDRLSEQAQFTGFDDGSGNRAINIVTKAANRNGQFGRVYAGYGTDDRYNAGGNVSLFKGDRRISLVGLFNNINQQNFSSEDLLGVTSSGGGRSGGGGNRGGGRMGGGGFGGSGNTGNFLVGQQNGISTTNSAGLNYSDKWGEKTEVSGSYFFNQSRTGNDQVSNTRFFINDTLDQFYDERELSSADNYNHRVNFRLEHKFDSSHSLVFTPSFSYQKNSSTNEIDGERYFIKGQPFDQSTIDRSSASSGYNTNNNLLYRYAFPKKGRTLSVNLGFGGNARNGESFLTSLNRISANPPRADSVRQVTENDVRGVNYSANLTYTEPAGEKGQLSLSYSPSFSKTTSDQIVHDFDSRTGKYDIFDTALSNKFENNVETHTAGLTFRQGEREKMFTVGLSFRYTGLDNFQQFPQLYDLDRSFTNILPNASFRRRFSAAKSLFVFYRSSANVPSVSQLQNVINNSNPLFLSSGNPALDQQINHTLSSRFTLSNANKGTSFFGNLFVQVSDGYISNAIYLASQDSVIDNGIVLRRGSQLSKPVNLDGYFSSRLFLTGAIPVKALKSNLNLNGGVTWSKIPGLVNNVNSKTDNITYNAGLVLASNISELIDFTVSYNAAFSNAVNSVNAGLNNRYVNQSVGAQFNLLSKKGWFIQNDLTGQFYSGLSEGFNQNYWLWNAGLGKKFLKKQEAELKFSVFDLLGQNRSISRIVSETSIEDVQNQVLTRYFMLTFSYRLRNFGTPPAMQREGRQGGWMPGMGRPGGMF